MAPEPDRDQEPLFALPFPAHDSKPTPLETVAGKKRKKTRPVSDDESNGSEAEVVDDREETASSAGDAVTRRWMRVRQELRRSEPPLLPPFLHLRRKIYSKEQSISVLTTIMYRCLQEKDYPRAGRAFALLLRTDFNTHHLDLRSRGLYGVGAELLLHQDRVMAPSDQHSHQPAVEVPSYAGFSEQNFAAAKAYYERLSIDYNFRNATSSFVSSLDFYPIVYGLWISVVQDQYLVTLQSRSESTDEAESMHSVTPDLDNALRIQQGKDQAREGAYAIEASLKELMMSPPYSESAYLRDLQSMIGQWIRDLGSSPQAVDQSTGGSDDPSSPEPVG